MAMLFGIPSYPMYIPYPVAPRVAVVFRGLVPFWAWITKANPSAIELSLGAFAAGVILNWNDVVKPEATDCSVVNQAEEISLPWSLVSRSTGGGPARTTGAPATEPFSARVVRSTFTVSDIVPVTPPKAAEM